MSNYIPKERLTAYERWEVAAFDEAERMAKAMQVAAGTLPLTAPQTSAQSIDAIPSAPAPETPAISEEELTKLREQAFSEGRAAGFEDGFKSGQADGYASGEALIKAESEKIATIATSFALSIENSEAQIADDLLALALDIAAQVLRISLKHKPELILPTVREAIGALANPHGHPSLLLHPDDASLVREQLGDLLAHTGWRILEDTQMSRGGCRVENGGAEIDATLEIRWQRAIESLGQEREWLDAP